MLNLTGLHKHCLVVPIVAGASLLSLGILYYKPHPPRQDPPIDLNIRGANGVPGAGGASTRRVSTALEVAFRTGGSTAEQGTQWEDTKDTRVASNLKGTPTKRDKDRAAYAHLPDKAIPRGRNDE
ncbi:uncharacterized protein B0J16DRAFT_405076 [Fusarium flagelliforme]|uniref:Uncharacterized protein n=1 Tax=Fusarium flagelliforme TaxID=2675880 RepID=A0A395M8K3_9HYPO|nr:uncharacterized protein B0J16DRAFT_405076 [Fusarium flagelliforme]KAH7175071.1 hypothetical protein B0J16DRAFT_405076 [Fusarium flagelliforme]RFN44232.1 hypothetical protein FIE12Z_11527 [Fusarium flagelliforme]